MSDDLGDLIKRLFQSAAPYLDDAFDAALSEASSDLLKDQCQERVRRLQSAAKGLAAIAGAIEAIRPQTVAGNGKRVGLD